MLAEADLKFLHMAQVQKIPETNNVAVHFHDDIDGSKVPTVIMGRKNLVLRLEKIANAIDPKEFWAVREAALKNARDAREYCWPQTV